MTELAERVEYGTTSEVLSNQQVIKTQQTVIDYQKEQKQKDCVKCPVWTELSCRDNSGFREPISLLLLLLLLLLVVVLLLLLVVVVLLSLSLLVLLNSKCSGLVTLWPYFLFSIPCTSCDADWLY